MVMQIVQAGIALLQLVHWPLPHGVQKSLGPLHSMLLQLLRWPIQGVQILVAAMAKAHILFSIAACLSRRCVQLLEGYDLS